MMPDEINQMNSKSCSKKKNVLIEIVSNQHCDGL